MSGSQDVHRVVVLALPQTVAFDLAVPAQVFGHRDEQAHYLLTVCAPEPGSVPTTTGFSIQVDEGLRALTTADTVVVPGYRPTETPDQPVLDALRDAADRGARMVSICIGAFALAAAGLLDGHRATTHWRDAAELARRYPLVQVDPDVLYVDQGQFLTSAGVAAGIDVCLHLVRRDRGSAEAARIARRMVVAPHRRGGQAQFVERPMPRTGGPSVAAVGEWALRTSRPPADRRRSGPARGRRAAHAGPAVGRRDGPDAVAVADRTTPAGGAAPARNVEPDDRRDRPAGRYRIGDPSADAVRPGAVDQPGGLPKRTSSQSLTQLAESLRTWSVLPLTPPHSPG